MQIGTETRDGVVNSGRTGPQLRFKQPSDGINPCIVYPPLTLRHQLQLELNIPHHRPSSFLLYYTSSLPLCMGFLSFCVFVFVSNVPVGRGMCLLIDSPLQPSA